MKSKKIILIISSTILYFVLIIQIIWIYYVDYIYMKRINLEVNIPTNTKKNLEIKNEYAIEYNEDELKGFKLLTNDYSKDNYVKHYSFNGEKYNILNTINRLEKGNIKIKRCEITCLDNNNISGQLIMEYKVKIN